MHDHKKLEKEEKYLDDLIDKLNVIPELDKKDEPAAADGEESDPSKEHSLDEGSDKDQLEAAVESEGEYCDSCDSKPCKCEVESA